MPDGEVITPDPDQYDPEYDPYLSHDERYTFCDSKRGNLNCRYICRGEGIITTDHAPTTGIWSPNYGPGAETYENNTFLELHGNCNEFEREASEVPWPPDDWESLEQCD